MNEFKQFNDWEEMEAYLGNAEVVANNNILPPQQGIVYGSYWLKATEDGILVYGRVHSQAEAEKGQSQAAKAQLHDTYERGYRFGRAYSVWCPGGELGDSHISVLWPIHEDEFCAAMVNGWQPTSQPWEREMLTRVRDEATAAVAASNDSPSPASPQDPKGDTT